MLAFEQVYSVGGEAILKQREHKRGEKMMFSHTHTVYHRVQDLGPDLCVYILEVGFGKTGFPLISLPRYPYVLKIITRYA
jgi:hypothetical protein